MDPADAFNIRSVKLAEATRVRLLSVARSRIQPSVAWLRMAECCTRGGYVLQCRACSLRANSATGHDKGVNPEVLNTQQCQHVARVSPTIV